MLALPVKAARAVIQERLPSSREPASRNLQALGPSERGIAAKPFRAPFRLLSTRAPRQAVLRVSSWLAPWHSPRDLAVSQCPRRAMRPIDICHPNELTCTRTSRVPGFRYRGFHHVGAPRNPWFRAA
jgi:hypothetical protein